MRCQLLKSCQFPLCFVSYFYRKDLLVIIRFLVDESCMRKWGQIFTLEFGALFTCDPERTVGHFKTKDSGLPNRNWPKAK